MAQKMDGNPPDFDGPAVDIEYDPSDYDDPEGDYDDPGDDDDFDDCGLTRSGDCLKAGTEYCDFECPNGG